MRDLLNTYRGIARLHLNKIGGEIMRYFNKEKDPNEGKKEFVPKYTIGGTMHDADNPPGSDEERLMRQIEASIKMNKSKMGRIFSPFTQEQLQSPDIIKPKKDNV